jgi:peptide/nickel transport system substrate-binding protein
LSGVFFCLLVVSGCSISTSRQQQIDADRTQLTIGVPETSVGGDEVGLGGLSTLLSVQELTQLSPDGRPMPHLAESWRWEKDNLRLRLKLLPKITFHDGTPLTATLAAQLLRDAIKREANLVQYPSLADIYDIRADGELDILIDLSRRSAFLPTDLAIPIRLGPQRLGTGPYRVVKSDPEELILEGYDRHHRGAPSIPRIVIRPYATLRTAWTSLLRGEVDMVTDVPPTAVEFIQNDTVQVVSFPRRYQYVVAFNSQRLPFKSPLVRQALNLAVDRERIISRVLNGAGTPATGPVWPTYWAYDSSVSSYGYDPSRAASMLDEAGFTSNSADRRGIRFRFTCLIPSNFVVWERVALEVQKSLYNIGVDMQFRVVPVNEFVALVSKGEFEAVLNNMISGPTPMRGYIFWRSARQFKGLNVFGYENAEAEDLFETLRESQNDASIRTATRRLQRVFLEDPPALFLAWDERARAIRRDFAIPEDPGRDPLFTLARWRPLTGGQPASR